MAITYTWSDILTMAQPQLRRDIEQGQASTAVNMAQYQIWNSADWRESVAVLPAFFLIPQEQDYYAPMAAVPQDFLGLRKCELVQYTSVPPWMRPLTIVQDLYLTGQEDLPSAISFEKSLPALHQGFRLHPRPPSSMTCAQYFVSGTYKKRPVKITAATLTSLVPWDDLYFNVLLSGILWAAAKLGGDDKRTASAQGQFVTDIVDMAFKEGFNIGEPQISPAEPLVGAGGFASNTLFF